MINNGGTNDRKTEPDSYQRARVHALVDAALEAGADAVQLASTLASLATSGETTSSASSKVSPAPLARVQQKRSQLTRQPTGTVASVGGTNRIDSSKVKFVSIRSVHVFIRATHLALHTRALRTEATTTNSGRQ